MMRGEGSGWRAAAPRVPAPRGAAGSEAAGRGRRVGGGGSEVAGRPPPEEEAFGRVLSPWGTCVCAGLKRRCGSRPRFSRYPKETNVRSAL